MAKRVSDAFVAGHTESSASDDSEEELTPIGVFKLSWTRRRRLSTVRLVSLGLWLVSWAVIGCFFLTVHSSALALPSRWRCFFGILAICGFPLMALAVVVASGSVPMREMERDIGAKGPKLWEVYLVIGLEFYTCALAILLCVAFSRGQARALPSLCFVVAIAPGPMGFMYTVNHARGMSCRCAMRLIEQMETESGLDWDELISEFHAVQVRYDELWSYNAAGAPVMLAALCGTFCVCVAVALHIVGTMSKDYAAISATSLALFFGGCLLVTIPLLLVSHVTSMWRPGLSDRSVPAAVARYAGRISRGATQTNLDVMSEPGKAAYRACLAYMQSAGNPFGIRMFGMLITTDFVLRSFMQVTVFAPTMYAILQSRMTALEG